MSPETIHTFAIDALNDLKAIDLVSLDVHDITTLADYIIICTGRSTRHVKSLAENVIKKAKEQQLTYIHAEGEQEGEWIVVDLADVIIHIMLPTAREFYNLEDLWDPNAHSHSRHRQ